MVNYDPIPKSESDLLLLEWGYDLMEEYFRMISSADFTPNSLVLDIATGTGRAASTLTRMGYYVITGDYNFDSKIESERRITDAYLTKVKYVRLNLEKIPFPDDAVENIVCINTVHELDDPFLCLKEIIRINTKTGKLLIADFNSEGFDVMDKLHTVRKGEVHSRGKISFEEIKNILVDNYSAIKEINTKLNRGFIASGNRNES
ncbi:MAG: class I SAM-dependent methyltransferase [Ignavibacteria bacterium]|nr:class I SAM-dependent methyltransferase [Ignavibacteria bacterium]